MKEDIALRRNIVQAQEQNRSKDTLGYLSYMIPYQIYNDNEMTNIGRYRETAIRVTSCHVHRIESQLTDSASQIHDKTF